MYIGASLVTWSTSIHSIISGPQVYDSFLGEFPESHGDLVYDKHSFSSSDEWSIREDHTNFRGHVASMHPRS